MQTSLQEPHQCISVCTGSRQPASVWGVLLHGGGGSQAAHNPPRQQQPIASAQPLLGLGASLLLLPHSPALLQPALQGRHVPALEQGPARAVGVFPHCLKTTGICCGILFKCGIVSRSSRCSACRCRLTQGKHSVAAASWIRRSAQRTPAQTLYARPSSVVHEQHPGTCRTMLDDVRACRSCT